MQDNADTSLSFLDVLTNGMGSLLVLFFLMAAIQGADGTASSEGDSRHGDQAADAEPFVVLIASPPDAILFTRPSAESWHVTGDAGFAARARRDVGPSHALLYADRPPARNGILALHDLQPSVATKVEVFVGRRRVLVVERKAGADGRLTLWSLGGKP